MIELDRSAEYHGAKIRIVGVGGGGGNAVNSMIERGLQGVEFLVVNTDMQALAKNSSPQRIQVGKALTRGLGAGANPVVGREAALEDREEVNQLLSGADMVFVTAGMGGGTGTGGAPVIAEIARELGALVVGIVTRPFDWEGNRRRDQAEEGIRELREHVDTLIVIPNQKLLSIIDKRTGFRDAFHKVDDVLYNATRGIAQIITGHGVVNVDFADVRTVMADMGDALMGTGSASGEFRAVEAAQNAISSPLLEGISIVGSEQVLINISASCDMTMMEVDEAVKVVHEAVGNEANVIFGVVLDDDLGETMMVTVIATGFSRKKETRSQQTARPAQAGATAQATVIQPPGQSGQSATQTPPVQPLPQTIRPLTTNLPDRVPSGPDEYERYNEPAFIRRNGGIQRGGFSITKKSDEEQEEEQIQRQAASTTNEQSSEKDNQHEVRRQAAADRPAFLRRIMD